MDTFVLVIPSSNQSMFHYFETIHTVESFHENYFLSFFFFFFFPCPSSSLSLPPFSFISAPVLRM